MSVSIGKTDRRVILTTALRAVAALIRWNVGACIEVSAARPTSSIARPCYLAASFAAGVAPCCDGLRAYPRLSSFLSPASTCRLDLIVDISKRVESVGNSERKSKVIQAAAAVVVAF